MFTGIVEAAVPVTDFRVVGTGAELVLPAPPLDDWAVAVGQSVAVSGACLTVAEVAPGGAMRFELSRETLERTWLRALEPGRRVNLERALRLGDRLDGHLVSGHVDGLGEVTSVEDSGDGGRLLGFAVEPRLARYVVDKGSITLDGTSLTVVEPEGARFRVALVPLTLERTTFGEAVAGTPVNVEADLIGKWVERLSAADGPRGADSGDRA